MTPRDILILIATLGAGACAALVMLSSNTFAVELPAPPTPAKNPPPVETPSSVPVAIDDSTGIRVGGPVDADLRRSDGSVDTTGWTSGIVRGDVQIAVSILDKIESISVVVEELRSPFGPDGKTFQRPNTIVQKVPLGIGTPTFEVKNIPFSDHPYSVSLYVPGLNGGCRTIPIDAQHPLHEDLVLAITPGVPYSVLLRDQDMGAYPGVEVRMIPVGAPQGRPPLQSTTDNYGGCVFENVLAGDYKIVTGQQGMQLAEPVTVTVQPGGRFFGTKIQGQSQTVTIERGQPLEVTASLPSGYRIADVKVHLQASDRVKLTQLEAMTDANGHVLFPHLTPGVWLVDFIKDGFQRSTRQITIKDNQPPTPLEVSLVRLR